ncbi:hypothetical protein CHLNCDRAFT_139612 [Chlorella variabilis]|uniref:Uncharacterized protein n=1 Tax=Chlorella variabilis TaxID=554065 RepID=E1ZQJ1_CHLVA|nr:hypothetical protein CHLNCDRAFT_139612 [Chlorella variabilis]EFN51947.1 hypothetical protein CHLNCDRAFT_139612 [Chlorella variabilis]|eukprot:XP_005844049.1 hypothetical protein CHLNCDRAFT_139612 [Chlorella variabilis]
MTPCWLSPPLCDICKTGWGRLNGTVATCVPCAPANCARCKGSTPNVCTVCLPRYFRTSQGTCKKCPANCVECENLTGKCLRCKPPTWDADAYSWAPVYGKTDAGTCVLCTPTSPNGGYHLGWCAACDGDKPSKCTKCVDKNNGFPMYVQQDKDCGFCTSLHGDKCLKCRNGDGKCVICDTDNGYIFDGVFSCKKP